MEPFRKLICAVMMLGAAAASAEDAGVYFALSGGVSKLELDPKIDDDDPWNATFIAGYRVNPHFALEAGYKHIDEVTWQERVFLVPRVPPFGAVSVLVDRELKISGFSAAAIGIAPIAENFEIYARAGVLLAEMDAGHQSYGSEGLLWGLGAQYDFNLNWSVRLDVERVESIGDADEAGEAELQLISLGVLYRL